MSKKTTFNVGDRITYSDVNLWRMTGVIVDLDRGKRGSDCHVKWDRDKLVTEECQFNLLKIER